VEKLFLKFLMLPMLPIFVSTLFAVGGPHICNASFARSSIPARSSRGVREIGIDFCIHELTVKLGEQLGNGILFFYKFLLELLFSC
jgi:hypothetical protein